MGNAARRRAPPWTGTTSSRWNGTVLVLPTCPTCRTPLDASRILRAQQHETGAAAGIDAMIEWWEVSVSCPGCLAAVVLEAYVHDLSAWKARESSSAAVVSRLRDRLAAAREQGDLERVLRAIFADGASAWLLGTPELFEYVREVLGRTVTVRTAALALPGIEVAGGFPPAWRRLFVPAKATRKGARRPPPPDGSVRIPAGATLTVIGVREGVLLCEYEGLSTIAHLDDLVDSRR